jgi:hypothetical protein
MATSGNSVLPRLGSDDILETPLQRFRAMLKPVRIGFGGFMGAFYASLVPTTPALQQFTTRGLKKSILWAPARMVDAAEEMLAAWQKNDTDSATTMPPEMPVILVAMAKDYMPTGRDFTRQLADSIPVMLPGDAKERLFGLRVAAGDIRAQVAIFAHDTGTASSIASQFLLYLDTVHGRRFPATFTHAGVTTEWPVQVESPDVPASSIPTDAKNLTMLIVDLTLKASIPLYDGPADDAPNDGQGTAGDASDPSGYPVVVQVNKFWNDAP